MPELRPHARGAAHVPADVHELPERDLERVGGVDVLGQPVRRPVRLGHEAAEQPVPDDQDAGVVDVEVVGVTTVVHPVVRRGVEHRLEPARHRRDLLGVQEELVRQAPRHRGEDDPGRNPDQRQRHPERQRQHRCPLLPQRRGEVVVRRRVVHDVARPEEPDPVRGAVKAVIGQVIGEEHDSPGPPGVRAQPQRRQLVQRGVDHQYDQPPEQVDHRVADAHQQAGPSVGRAVTAHRVGLLTEAELVVVQDVDRDDLERKEHHENRDGEQHGIVDLGE
ncbi:hypothetical protein RM423_08035 [Jatrophihabitans sp. DSM 44399]|uniref:Uncharacterized protein n=1 Tax=Jatrophihabitans lederbergiae TaxID=3075547 RepID=A0ABU2J9C6_9ACTN|nr:hypothetical protein [Jatrophihabitans sp. DSM 44399]MDT0261343.1 hypothetical protein [Jatrophihabitans sp. DSM 44399]